MTEAPLQFVNRAGTRLAFRYRPPGRSGNRPTLVFLPGLRSDMTGDKASALDRFAEAHGHGCLRFDYAGHGQSGGAFTDGSIASWADDALAVIAATVPGPVLLIGSSMGGWIGLLVAMRLGPQAGVQAAGFVGIAAAPDFTRTMRAALSPAQTAALARGETLHLPAEPDPLPLTAGFLDGGDANRVLNRDIALHCPVRLLHGQQDAVVPWRTALAIAERVQGTDCRVMLVKDGDHRLSRPADVALLLTTIGEWFTDRSEARAPTEPVIRPAAAGDAAEVAARQSRLYADSHGWGRPLEVLVTETVAAFLRDFKPGREQCWIAELDGMMAGAVFLTDEGDGTARLRLLHVEPGARGRGIGDRLVATCIEFAAECGYREITLWTHTVLDAARRLYARHGFVCIATETHGSFGKPVQGETWRLMLASSDQPGASSARIAASPSR